MNREDVGPGFASCGLRCGYGGTTYVNVNVIYKDLYDGQTMVSDMKELMRGTRRQVNDMVLGSIEQVTGG